MKIPCVTKQYMVSGPDTEGYLNSEGNTISKVRFELSIRICCLFRFLVLLCSGGGGRLALSNLYKESPHMHKHSLFSLLTLLGWHWLTALYEFQAYNSIIHRLYIALYAHHQKSSVTMHLSSLTLSSLPLWQPPYCYLQYFFNWL